MKENPPYEFAPNNDKGTPSWDIFFDDGETRVQIIANLPSGYTAKMMTEMANDAYLRGQIHVMAAIT